MWPNVWGGQRLIIYKPSCWRNVIRLFSPPPLSLSLSKEERQITPHAQLKIKAEIRPNSDLSRRCVSDSSATTKIFSLLLWFEPAVSNCRGKPEGWVWNKKRPSFECDWRVNRLSDQICTKSSRYFCFLQSLFLNHSYLLFLKWLFHS